MDATELRNRTRSFGSNVIDLCMELGCDIFAQVVGKQLLRAGTGVAANHRAASRSRSRQEFAARLATVVEEADEAELWLDYIEAKKRGPAHVVADLRSEAVELRAIFSKSRATTLERLREQQEARRRRPRS
jgi:four helix bundle protein